MKRTWPYDMWSLGVTWLEIIMGRPHVFQVDPRMRAKLYHQLNMEAMSEVSVPCMPVSLESSGMFSCCFANHGDSMGYCFAGRPQVCCLWIRPSVDALQSDMQLAFWLRGLMELCIYPPKPGSATGEPLSSC